MKRKFTPYELEFYKRCDEVLHYIWDPIGVAGCPSARDEYNSYLPKVFQLVRDETEPLVIENYLVSIEDKSMGVFINRQGASAAVEVLIKWREWLQECSTDLERSSEAQRRHWCPTRTLRQIYIAQFSIS